MVMIEKNQEGKLVPKKDQRKRKRKNLDLNKIKTLIKLMRVLY